MVSWRMSDMDLGMCSELGHRFIGNARIEGEQVVFGQIGCSGRQVQFKATAGRRSTQPLITMAAYRERARNSAQAYAGKASRSRTANTAVI